MPIPYLIHTQGTDVSYQHQPRVKPTIHVARLILQESGTYNPLYSRPYQTHVEQATLDNLNRRIDETRGGKITGSLFAGIASNIVAPSSTPGLEIPIPLSWTERRIRFVMEVHVTLPTGSTMIYYFQGYTSHLGVTPNGAVDPQMEFYINSFIRVNRSNQITPYGTVLRDVITESAHIVNGQVVSQFNHGDVYGLRPQDIFTGIQSGYLNEAYRAYPGSGGTDTLYDTRVGLRGESLRSNRSNNLACNYVAKIVDTYQTGKQLADFGQSDQDIFGRCQNIVHEASPFENTFIKAISNIRGGHCVTSFTMPDLLRIDPGAEANTNYICLGTTVSSQMHQTGQTAYWNGTDRETLAATIISNSIPAIMMELMISGIHFLSTNHAIGGVVNTTIVNVKSLTNADLTTNLEIFKSRLEREVLFDMTHSNFDLYQLEVQSDLFGETRISIAFENGPVYTYTTPSFCDSLLSPVISTGKDGFYTIANDFEIMMNNLPSEQTTAAINGLV